MNEYGIFRAKDRHSVLLTDEVAYRSRLESRQISVWTADWRSSDIRDFKCWKARTGPFFDWLRPLAFKRSVSEGLRYAWLTTVLLRQFESQRRGFGEGEIKPWFFELFSTTLTVGRSASIIFRYAGLSGFRIAGFARRHILHRRQVLHRRSGAAITSGDG